MGKSVSLLFRVTPTFISAYHLAVFNPIGQFVVVVITPPGEAIRVVAGYPSADPAANKRRTG
jgi:hypothetical protein